MSEIDQQFIEYVVKSLVGNPDAVSVVRTIDEKGVLLELTVDPEDLGRVIGKRGATAQSLRTLLRALGTKNDARYNLKIVDNGTGGHRDGQTQDQPSRDTATSRSQDDNTDSPQPTEEVETATEEVAVDEPATEEAAPEAETSDRLRQTREELAEFDDLDV